jgi:hypothetical protein
MAEIQITLDDAGRAYLSLSPSSTVEVRDSVALDELEQGEEPNEDPTQGREVGERPGEDPTAKA